MSDDIMQDKHILRNWMRRCVDLERELKEAHEVVQLRDAEIARLREEVERIAEIRDGYEKQLNANADYDMLRDGELTRLRSLVKECEEAIKYLVNSPNPKDDDYIFKQCSSLLSKIRGEK